MTALPIKTTSLQLTVLLLVSGTGLAAVPETVRFNRDIRPILSNHCFQCHGPDEAHREADLRLDEESGLRSGFGDSLTTSPAWQRIISDDPDEVMPPPAASLDLKPEQRAILKRWIEQGAEWEGHWSFIPPRKPDLPAVQSADWTKNPIDFFILARLEAEGLSPAAAADRERLLRRVTLDLTGLPPTVQEIDEFLADDSPDAYEKVVDRLLASQHFGERMALNWMDAARYGDTSVFHADGPRDMWPWRDWVIESYNANKPFDQFTIDQLAGDLVDNPSSDQLVATGFLRNNASTDEGGAIAEEFRVEYAVDRVKTTSMVWMGLSLECAQCHNHKYDPFTQREYYRFFAYFNQASDPGMQTRSGNQSPVTEVFRDGQLDERDALKARLPEFDTRLAARRSAAGDAFQEWVARASAEAAGRDVLPADCVLHVPFDEGQGSTVASASEPVVSGTIHGKASWVDGHQGRAWECDAASWIDLGQVADFERDQKFSYGLWVKPAGNATGAPVARMQDGQAYRGFDLHFAGGKVAVHLINSWPANAVKVTTKAALKKDTWQHVFVTYDGSSKAAGIKIYFDGKPQEWTIEQDGLTDTIRTEVPLYVGRRNPGSPYRGLVDELRVYSRELTAAEVETLAGADPIAPILALASEERTESQVELLRTHYLNNLDADYRGIVQEKTALETRIAELSKPVSTVMIMKDVPQLRMTYILERGNYASPLKDREVQPGVPEILPPLPEDAPANRLAMARWLVSGQHPLTARVTVNRYWHMLFGTGLVKTLEDFGAQGEWPSHPDLLDWLALDFVENGWNIKRTLKQIVMSAAYRQSSRATPELVARDPENRLIARGPRFRLQGELLRDQALAASGLLVPVIGGPGVKPYQPPGLWNEVSLSGNVRFVQDKGEKLYRRSLYTYWKRSSPAPAMTIFDAPTREKCVLRRSRTNTPLQALVTLNDPQFVEAARALAQRVLRAQPDSVESQIELACRLATGVKPSESTVRILSEAFTEELAVFQADEARASQLLSVGESPRDEKLSTATHAAMTIVCSMILNLDESITRG